LLQHNQHSDDDHQTNAAVPLPRCITWQRVLKKGAYQSCLSTGCRQCRRSMALGVRPYLRQHLVFCPQCCKLAAGLAGLGQCVSKGDLTMLRLGPAADSMRCCIWLTLAAVHPAPRGPVHRPWTGPVLHGMCVTPCMPKWVCRWLSATV
jgi:hypothetical protein